MLDEHADRSPHGWLQHTDWYDRYERSGPTVCMGEYAAWSSTLRAALAEAAFMIGMERNGDVVRLASYAPLLAKEGSTQWLPDLLYFTSTQVRTTASFHVQRMFTGVGGGTVCDVVIEGARLRVEIDGEVLHELLDDNLPERTVVVGASQAADGTRVVRAVNASSAARRVRLDSGLAGPVSARRETLTGTRPGESAPFDQWPHPPTTHESTGTTPTLDVELPAWSFSVLTPTVDPEHPAQGAFA